MNQLDPLFLETQASELENAFFLNQDKKLIEKMREMKKLKETKENLAKVSGIQNDEVLHKLVELNVHPQTVASLALIPIIEVAWADGVIDEKEREVLLSASQEAGFAKGISLEIITQWLTHKPEPKLFEAWSHYVKGLCEKLSDDERKKIKTEIVSHSRKVAEAAGGILGVGKISAQEKAMLEKIKNVFC